jgi:hypothetical protein
MTWSSVIALPPTIAERTFLLVVSLDLSKSTSSLVLKNSTVVSCSRSCLEVGTVSTGSGEFRGSNLGCKAYMLGLTPTNICSSFRKCGIYLFDPSAVDTVNFLPSTVFKSKKTQPSNTEVEPTPITDTEPVKHRFVGVRPSMYALQPRLQTECLGIDDDEFSLMNFAFKLSYIFWNGPKHPTSNG